MKKFLSLFLSLLCLCTVASPLLAGTYPPDTITGKVVDAQGAPVMGATVMESGTSNVTTTDIDGNFTLTVKENAQLEITFIGYQKVVVKATPAMTVTLVEDSTLLSELVVVGYGVQKKVNVIGSIAQVDAAKLENRSTPSLSNALTGQMSGVTVIQRSGEPGADGATIRVRGVGSYGATPNPLILVDGIPGSLDNLNMDDVASISVLKDASTAAIYGARSANGVILVTTKSGAQGKIRVGYNAYLGVSNPTAFPDKLETWEYATYYNKALGSVAYTPEEIQKFKDGSDPDHYANENYLEGVFTRKGLQTGHDISIDGGNEKNQYRLSFGYLYQRGLVEKNDFSRYNIRVNLSNELFKNVVLNTRVSGMTSIRETPSTPYGKDTAGMSGIIVNAVRFPGTYPTYLSNGNFSTGTEGYGTPVAWIQTPSFYWSKGYKFTLNEQLTWKPVKGLTIAAVGAYDYAMGESKHYRSSIKLNDRTSATTWLSNAMDKTIYKSFQATVGYDNTFGGHTLGLLAGYSWEQSDYNIVSGSRETFPSDDLTELNAGSQDAMKNSGTGNGWAIQSIFGRLQYNFKERYLLEGTARYDGSSRFPNDNKYGFFPSVAAGWRISEENFMKNSTSLGFISNLKLKASWGILGNQNIGNYPYQSMYNLGYSYPFGDVMQQGAAITTAVDATLHWEETETIDGGFEMSLWKGKLMLDVNYFYRQTSGILYTPSASVSNVFGYNLSQMNTGDLLNKGWEVEINHRNTVGDFAYSIGGNFTYLNNKVTSLGLGNVEQPNGMVGNGSSLFIGYPMSMYYGYKTDGVFTSQEEIDNAPSQKALGGTSKPGDVRYQDIYEDGVIDAKDRTCLGSTIPKYTFGVNLSVEYKGFTLSAQLQGVFGVKGMLDTYAGYAFFNLGGIQRWQAEGAWDAETNNVRYPAYPRLEVMSNAGSANVVTSDLWVRDASYVRLKNIQLGYSLPERALKKMKMSGLYIYLQGENAYTWSNYPKGWDPEINSSGAYYPILATYTLGLNFKF